MLVQRSVRVPGGSRLTVNPADLDPRLEDTALWTEVLAPESAPIVAERVTWWPGKNWLDGHTALAAAKPAARWLAVGGHQGGSSRQVTYVMVANASKWRQKVRVTVLGAAGPLASTQIHVRAGSRYTVDMTDTFPKIRGSFSVLVESVGGKGQLVVEQAVYRDAGGQKWAAGSAAPARPLND